MTIRIISSRKLRFYSPDRQQSVVAEGKNVIQDLPDWIVKDGMFQVAKQSGIISILSTRAEQKKAEENPERVVPQSAHESAPVSEENLEESGEPTLEPGGGAEIEEPEYEEAAEDASAPTQEEIEEYEAKAAAKKAARAARRAAKKEK